MSDEMSGPVAPSATARSALRPVPHDVVRLHPGGWLGEWQRRNLDATVPHVLDQLEKGEAWSNLARLVGDTAAPWRGMVFTDSDVHKALEAVAWAGSDLDPDHPVVARGQALVELLARAQEPDGYLNSHVQGVPEVERWSDPQWGHELYCAGHLFQAAVAAARTGALPGLVEVATRFADLLVETFGEDAPIYVEGHPEVETALVELFRVTGRREYLTLAQRQLAQRGHGWLGEDRFGSSYFQDHVPVHDGAAATGHAVRQLYLLSGAVDVAVETGDVALLDAVLRTWSDLAHTKTYVTGAHGSRHRDEAIGDPYELPADRAYAETCAAIASLQLCWRLLLATGESRFADEMETALYNAVAVSTAVDGRAFFYSNPLQLRTGHEGGHEDAPSERRSWYSCACCPPNIARLLASVHDYLLTTTNVGLQLHHPTSATLTTMWGEGSVTLDVRTGYPYDGRVEIDVESTAGRAWELAVRVPGWCDEVTVGVDGEPLAVEPVDGAVRLHREWDGGPHHVVVEYAMPVRTVTAHPRVDALRGCVALVRGPVVYAVEQVDVGADTVLEDLRLVRVVGTRELAPTASASAPVVLELEMTRVDGDDAPLYRAGPAADDRADGAADTAADTSADPTTVTVTAVPYHRWANREPGAMRVFLPTAAPVR